MHLIGDEIANGLVVADAVADAAILACTKRPPIYKLIVPAPDAGPVMVKVPAAAVPAPLSSCAMAWTSRKSLAFLNASSI